MRLKASKNHHIIITEQSMSDLTITFYSTLPEAKGRSKYPKQNKLSYKMPSSKATITIPAYESQTNVKPDLRSAKKELTGEKSSSDNTHSGRQNKVSEVCNVTKRPKRNARPPLRYEPIETVTDDYKTTEYDSDTTEYSSD